MPAGCSAAGPAARAAIDTLQRSDRRSDGRYRCALRTFTTCASSIGVSALCGRACGPRRPSSPSRAVRQRSIVRTEIPMTRQADASRAPDAWASAIAARTTSRSRRPCFRPRPPGTSPPLFFEHEQRGRLGQRLLFSGELPLELSPLELSDPPGGQRCGSATFLEGDSPVLVLGEPHMFALEKRREFFTRQLGPFGQDANLLLEGPPAAHSNARLRARHVT